MAHHSFSKSGIIIKALILLGFGIYLYLLVESGDISLFINPRYVVLTKFAYIALAIMFLVQTGRLFSRSRHACDDYGPSGPLLNRTVLPFVFTLLVAFFVPNTTLDANLAANKGLEPVSGYAGEKSGANSGGNDNTVEKTGQRDTAAVSGVIEVTDENFMAVLTSLYVAPADYSGQEIVLRGFVYRQPDYAANRFGLVRFVVNCCTADAILDGMICEAEDALKYADGSWLQVRGTVALDNYDGQEIPVINIISLEPVEEPANPYIYPQL